MQTSDSNTTHILTLTDVDHECSSFDLFLMQDHACSIKLTDKCKQIGRLNNK